MSILQYFTVIKKSRTDDQPCSLSVTLPDPRPLSDKVLTAAITSANASYCLKGQRVKRPENKRGRVVASSIYVY